MFVQKNGKPYAIPPFSEESARAKVQAAEDAWNSKDPERVSLAYPPAIARTLGLELVEVDYAKTVIEIKATTESFGNPVGTIHGGLMGNIADTAIGTAHLTTLDVGESFTSIDLKINFFRPIWDVTLRANAQAVQIGKTISYYECKIVDEKGRLIAVVSSSLMTLRGDKAKGR